MYTHQKNTVCENSTSNIINLYTTSDKNFNYKTLVTHFKNINSSKYTRLFYTFITKQFIYIDYVLIYYLKIKN